MGKDVRVVTLSKLDGRRVVVLSQPGDHPMFGGKVFDDEADARSFVADANAKSDIRTYRIKGGCKGRKGLQKELPF